MRELGMADPLCPQSKNAITNLTEPGISGTERQPDCRDTIENTDALSLNSCGPGTMEVLGVDNTFKEEAMEMMDKDELDELLGLQVQFGEGSALPLAPCKDADAKEEAKPAPWPGRRSMMSQHVQVNIGGDAFQMWSDVGAAHGLHSDPEIATFLLQHYENTKSILIPSSKCTACSQPLSLFCSHCNCLVQSPSSSAEPTPGNIPRRKATTDEMPSETAKTILKKMTVFSKVRKKKKVEKITENSTATVLEPTSLNNDRNNYDSGNNGADNYDDDDIDAEDVTDHQDNGGNLDSRVQRKEQQERGTSFAQATQVARRLRDVSKKQDRTFNTNNSKYPKPVMVGGERKVFRCKMCSHTYTRACSLKAHMRKHTGEKPFKCKLCDAAFSLSGSLIVHQRTHTGDKPFVCEECGQKFSIANALKQHRRQHTGEKPYHCKICFSKYSRSDSLKVHMRTHSGDRPFICEVCGADFSRLYCLIAHKKKHSGERPFKCIECQATFTQSGKLTIHMRKHTGDRPFQCEQCGASFTQSDRLKTHLRIHSGEKPYKCGQCGKGFSHPHSLKVHCRVHTGDRPYKCEICSLTFADPSYFRRHKAKHANPVELGVRTAANTSISDAAAGSFHHPSPSPDDFAVPLSGAESLGALQATDMGLSSSASTMISAGFPVANAPSETAGSPDCFSEASAGFSIPLSSSVPSLGFSLPSSTGLGFAVPSGSAMNVLADGTDAASSISAADSFAFLRTALHCHGSYPS